MAIRVMTSKDDAGLPNVETVRDYLGHEEGLCRHAKGCPHFNPERGGNEIRIEGLYPDCKTDWDSSERCDGPFEPLYMKTTHVGLVLALREINGYDDSDFEALVWNPDKGESEWVSYATTRGWTYPNGAWVDATPEVIEAWKAWSEARAAARAAEAEEKARRTPGPGKTLRVVSGRKVPRGTVGQCVWYGQGKRYGYYGATPMRVGLKTADGTIHWTAASNVEVVLEEQSGSDNEQPWGETHSAF